MTGLILYKSSVFSYEEEINQSTLQHLCYKKGNIFHRIGYILVGETIKIHFKFPNSF